MCGKQELQLRFALRDVCDKWKRETTVHSYATNQPNFKGLIFFSSGLCLFWSFNGTMNVLCNKVVDFLNR